MRILTLLLFIVLGYTATAQPVDYTPPPGFEKSITDKDYKKIVDLSLPIISKHCTINYVWEGSVHVRQGDDTGAISLDNLVLKCLDVEDRSLWDNVVLEHMNNLFSSFDEQNNIDTRNYDSVRRYLSLRIYTDEGVVQRGGLENLVTQVDLEGTHTVLMLDLTGAFTPVQKTDFDTWKKDLGEVFETAQEHVDKQKVEKVSKVIKVDGQDITINYIVNEDYAASYALDLIRNTPEFVGEWGSVLTIPNKGLVTSCKVSSDNPFDYIKFIQGTKTTNDKAFAEHAQPVSNQYFWYYHDTFTPIKVVLTDDYCTNVTSPAALVQLTTEPKQ